MPQPDYEDDLVFPPQENQVQKMNFTSSEVEPNEPMYIISDENHIGWYFNGAVYHYTYQENKAPQPSNKPLEDWCKFWMPLIDVCRAAQGRFEDCLLATQF